jgi:hypothetical protein
MRGRFLNLSSLTGEKENVDDMRWMPWSPNILESKSDWRMHLVDSSQSSSPKVGRTSIDVLPRSDFTSNLASVTPSLSVIDEKVSPTKTADTIPFLRTGISGGVTTLDGDIFPLEIPPL